MTSKTGSEASLGRPESGASNPDAELQDSMDLLAQHYTGFLGGLIDEALVDPRNAASDISELIGEAESAVSDCGLRRSLDEFEGLSDNDTNRIFAYASGAFHGVIAVAQAVLSELAHEGGNDFPGHLQIAKNCQIVADRLMILDFETPSVVTHEEPKEHPGVDYQLTLEYASGVNNTLEGLVSTVRACVQQRLATLFETTERTESDDRLTTLLYIALTNPPMSRIVRLLGEHYRDLAQSEQEAGHVEDAIVRENPPLKLTDQGGLAARELLRLAA